MPSWLPYLRQSHFCHLLPSEFGGVILGWEIHMEALYPEKTPWCPLLGNNSLHFQITWTNPVST
jgi:hypothetical protein